MKPETAKLIQLFSKSGWELETREGYADVLASRCGGIPYAVADDEWPVCKICKHGMIFVCQIALDSEQQKYFNLQQLVQLFCCPRCHTLGDMPKGSFSVRQFPNPSREQHQVTYATHPVKRSPVYKWLANVNSEVRQYALPVRNKISCMPSSDEIEELIKTSTKSEIKQVGKSLPKDYWDDDYDDDIEERSQQRYSGAQLGGYAFWMQGYERHICRQCKNTLDVFLQLDAETCWIAADGFAILLYCKNDPTEFLLTVTST